MRSKKRGKEYSIDELFDIEQAKHDFFYAADAVGDLLEEFEELELAKGPAIGGALTQLIAYLIICSPDTSAAMGLLSTCISNATNIVPNKTTPTHEAPDISH